MSSSSSSSFRRHLLTSVSSILTAYPLLIGLSIRLVLVFTLPLLLDDGLLLRGVRYTDVDYDVFTDAASHVAAGNSPYNRHTYRYTPFLAGLLALPMKDERYYQSPPSSSSCSSWRRRIANLIFSTRYFGKILFCTADVICGHIVIVLRRKARQRRRRRQQNTTTSSSSPSSQSAPSQRPSTTTTELIDTLWWMYNPLPINICTRGSAESLVVLLPVLTTVVFADTSSPSSSSTSTTTTIEDEEAKVTTWWKFVIRATIAGLFHGISIHAKLYPVIYTISYMANFAYNNERRMYDAKKTKVEEELLLQQRQIVVVTTNGQCGSSPFGNNNTTLAVKSREEEEEEEEEERMSSSFPWTHPKRIVKLAILWSKRLFLTASSMTFLAVSIGTVGILTYLAVRQYGPMALDEGLLYHFVRIDHRHNYSMYWYWIYLARGRAAEMVALGGGGEFDDGRIMSAILSLLPLLPQMIILGYASLGIAPYDITFAIFIQTYTFVTFNKVITAQYFTWYICLLPLCSPRICWNTKRMYIALASLGIAIVTWLGMAFTLEMLGWETYMQVWMASVLFFVANVNLLLAIVNGYTGDLANKNNRSLLARVKVL